MGRFQNLFGKRQKIQEDIPKINIKGQKVYEQSKGQFPEVNFGEIERQWYGLDKGPRMLPRRQRFKVWAAFLGISSWFVGCFCLVAYRLRSDDLELMEREVYEELKIKKEVEQFQKRQKRIDELNSRRAAGLPIKSEEDEDETKMVGEVSL